MHRVYKINEEVVARQIAGETILVPIKGRLADLQRIFMLNPVAEFIWNNLNGESNLEKIRDKLTVHFEVGEKEAEADLNEFIHELVEADLILPVS